METSLPTRAPWRLLGRDQLVLALLCLVLLVVGAVTYVVDGVRPPRGVKRLAAGERIDYRVDLNRAGVDELNLLPGIGPARAARIVKYREANGPFESLADLARVPGIGRECVEKLRGLVVPDAVRATGEGER